MGKVSIDDLTFNPQWQYRNPNSGITYRNGIISGYLFFSSLSGDIQIEDAEAVEGILEKLFNEGGFDNSSYIRIADYSSTNGGSLFARQKYAQTIKRINQKHNCSPSVTFICGSSNITKVTLLFAQKLVGQKFVFVSTVDEAFERIGSDHLPNVTGNVTVSQKDINALIELSGSAVWGEESDVSTVVDTDSPLYLLYEAISIFSKDVRSMIRKIKTQEEKYHTLYNSTSDSVMLLNEKGFFDCNPQTLLMFGCSTLEEFCSKHPADLSPPTQPNGSDSMISANEKIETAMEKGSNRFEWIHKRYDTGKPFPAEVLLSAMEIDGKRVIQATVRNITERKQKEAELLRSKEEAESANKIKSDFLANMSHEIRTPMNAIIGFTDLLYNAEDDIEKKKKLELVKTSGKNLLSLINDILDFSKIEAGKIDMENKSFNPKATLRHLYSMYKRKADEKGLDFNVSIDKTIPEFISGDEHRIIQILTNIIGNSLKFTEKGNITIDGSYNKGLGVFRISDTGIGISKDKLDHVFSAFNQADSSTERKYGGTGLGLTISRQLAELMGGSLSVVSTEGSGSTFTLELPLREVPPETEAFGTSKTDIGNEITTGKNISLYRILLAEDNRINQALIKALLKGLDLDCNIAENGKIALDMLKEAPYDLLLLDMQMPVMDGLETIKQIRSDKNMKNMHVIALTANAIEGDSEKYIKAGCDDYLSKPIDRELFQKKIHNFEH